MAPNADWEGIMAADPLAIQDTEDDGLVTEWCNKIADLDITKEKNVDKLHQAFLLSQTLMSRKQIESDLFKEESDNLANQIDDLETTDRQQQDEIRVLEGELSKLRRFGDDGAAAAGGNVDHTRIIRQELEACERELSMVKSELAEKERLVERERTGTDAYQQKIKDLERECQRVEELKRENDRQRSDIGDYIQRLKNLTDAGQGRHHDDLALREKLQEKNKELLNLNDEYLNLMTHNQQLEEKQKVMEERMNSATSDMNRITEDYVKQKTVLKETDSVLDGLRRDNERLRIQVQDMTDQVKSKGDTEDEIMIAVNNKVEEWKKVLASKDSQLLEYREQLLQQKEQIIAMSMDSERAKMSALERGVDERDEQIRSLQDKLSQATDEMEQANALIEDLRAQINKEFTGPGSSDVHIRKIKELQGTLKDTTYQSKNMEERLENAEKDAREKDKQLNELMERLQKYENKIIGLPEAVAEIKDCKLQIQIRDRQIVELTQNVNSLGNQMNDLADENEELRERLGLDPKESVDLTDYRNRKVVRKEEERAVNQVLQKEVERLEEERLELKQQIRKLAQHTGQRAVALGLTTDDVTAIEDFTETLKKKRSPYDVSQLKKDAETDELKSRALQLAQESEKYQKDMERIRQTNAELNIRIKEVDAENKKLEQGLKEVLKSVKDANAGGRADGTAAVNVESPTLERMLAAIEAKQITGNYDAALHLKAQVDNLTGRNEELRRELREARVEGSRAKLELERASSKVSKLEEDLSVVRDAGGMGMLFQTLALPEGMAVSSADVIASLNEHLVQTLHELSSKEEMLSRMEKGLETYKGKFAVVRHQLGLVYQQFSAERKDWQESIEKSEKKMRELEGVMSEDKVKIQEHDRLVETLSKDDSEVRRRLADQSRKTTVLRVNEKALSRRYTVMQEIEASLRKENTKLKNEVIAMETAVTERLGYLQRYKDMASFKIATLQKTREESVPLSELEAANKQYEELTEKYRDLLDRSNNMIAKNEHSATLEMELKRLQHEKDGLSQELKIEKEKTHTYQASFEQLQRQGINMTPTNLDNEAMTSAKKLATLEMKEINERQRAEHAVRMYEQRKQMIDDLENRNTELEQKFAEVTKMNLEAQRTERQLRDELSNCILKSVSDADRARITVLEASENGLKIESSRLKEIADVAMSQASAMEQQKVSQEKEVLSLRQQLIDIQAQSDEKKVIGKLHRHIVQLQVSEGTAVKKLEDAGKRITKLQAQLLRMEQRLDEKDQALLHHRAESANKSRHLRRTIHELRRMFSGAVPLSKQERFARAMVQLQEDKDNFAKQLKQMTDDRVAVEDKLACLNVQYAGLQELISTLKDGKGANKVVEWHGKMEGLRLEELKKTRQIQRLTEQTSFKENAVRQHEATISSLEEEQVKMSRRFEERQLQWEQREMEMERIINKLENQQQEIAGAASKFEEATGSLPDITLPVSEQLEQAIATIKNNVRVIIETQTESRNIKSKLIDLEHKLKEADANILSRDRLISELRLRMPATAERDAAIAKATANAQYQEEQYETKQALRVAQSTIGSLQARITQKEQTIGKLQGLLQQSRDEMLELCNKHETDMKLMMDRLHIKSDDAFVKFKQSAMSNANQPTQGAPTNKQLARMNELEDTVVQQDNQIGALSERIRSLQGEVQKWRHKEERTTINLSKDKEKLIEEHHMLVQKLDKENEDLRKQLASHTQRISELNADLNNEKDAANRGPTAAAKEHMNRLKQQIQEKDDELQRMSNALKELRSDLVHQAEEAVKVNASNAAQDWNIQKLIDKKTKDLRERIDELEHDLEKARRGAGARKSDKEVQLHMENEELRDELSRKESALGRLKESKRRLEEENETLERKVERLSASNKKPSGGSSKQEMDTLRNQVKSLEQQLSDSKMRLNRAEKPSEDILRQSTHANRSTAAVEKWEETKKMQKLLEKTKSKLANVESECAKLKSNNDMLKNAVERANKAKEALEKKAYKNAPPTGMSKTAGLNEQELRDQNAQLHNELSDVRQQLLMTRDVAYEEVQMRNRQLTDKLEQMEKYIQAKKEKEGGGGVGDAYPDLVAREQKLQSDVLKLSEENLSLRFEIAQAQQEMPRLKEKIQSQKMYIEAMKADRDGDTASARSFGSWASGSQASMIRRIGESGRSNKDLEKTISLLKKVVEKKQAEVERLKMAPGVVSNEKLTNFERENESLREQLDDLRSKMGATLTERYEMKDKGTKKLTHDFEKLRKDLRKEQENSEKLQVALNSARLTAEQHQRQVEELRAELGEVGSKPSQGQMDQKTWKVTAVSKLNEEKVNRLGSELENKTKMVTDMKMLLRDSATREKELLNEKEELERKIQILERFPPGAQLTDSEVMSQLQQAKLYNQRLEDEKTELLHEVRKLKGHSVAEDYDESMVERARKYDFAVRDQADLSNKLQESKQMCQKFHTENDKLKRELANFGPEFFEEIEDLKYNYRESEIRNAQLEEKLQEVCGRFGVSM